MSNYSSIEILLRQILALILWCMELVFNPLFVGVGGDTIASITRDVSFCKWSLSWVSIGRSSPKIIEDKNCVMIENRINEL